MKLELKIHNSLTKKKEVFVPISPGRVKMYVCGPTVYDFLHIGNFRGPVVFNLIRNLLEELDYEVDFALNFTDVDDKIIKKANEINSSSLSVSEKYIAEYKKDFELLGLRKHDHNPKVTDSIQAILSMIQKLIDNKIAYVQNGDVLYSIEKFKEYGKLSGRKTEDLLAGARVEVDESKLNPLDFVLWKKAKPGEPTWDSPWGPGRPGWHIECSAMIQKIFGDQIDIHGGGADLIFPHHENEIAQSEGCTRKAFVNYWVHWQMLNFSGQKMSKSLGNIISLREFVEKYHAEIYKFMILSVHYRSVADFGDDTIDRSIASLAKIYSSLSLAENLLETSGSFPLNSITNSNVKMDSEMQSEMQQHWDKLFHSLLDDFNTVEMMSVVYEVIKNFNQKVKRGMKPNQQVIKQCLQLRLFMQKLGKISSLFQEKPTDFLQFLDQRLIELRHIDIVKVKQLIDERVKVRELKDYKKSDELRDELNRMGIAISDTPEGVHWEVMKT